MGDSLLDRQTKSSHPALALGQFLASFVQYLAQTASSTNLRIREKAH
jgi:hypothetical protein